MNPLKHFGIRRQKKEIINLAGKSYSHIWQDLLGKKIGEGFHAKVHEVRHKQKKDDIKKFYGKRMVVKIGMTEDLPFGFISLPRKFVGNTVEWIFGSTVKVFHTKESIIKAYEEEYLLIKKYFSPLYIKSKEENPRDKIINDLQNKETNFYKEIFKILKNEKSVELVLNIFKKHKDNNFLKDERLVIGHPPHLTQDELDALLRREREIPITYYIFQEMVEGNIVPLSVIKNEELTKRKELVEKLLTFVLLQKRMYEDTGKMIDTRSEHPWRYPYEWFQKTGNLLIDKNSNDIYFIDTRWLWDSKVRFLGKNGLHLIERLGNKSLERAIRRYTKILKKD